MGWDVSRGRSAERGPSGEGGGSPQYLESARSAWRASDIQPVSFGGAFGGDGGGQRFCGGDRIPRRGRRCVGGALLRLLFPAMANAGVGSCVGVLYGVAP